MQDERLFVLLGKKMNGEATEDELAELAQILDETPIRNHTIELIQEVWKKKPSTKDRLPEQKWKQLVERINQPGIEIATTDVANARIARPQYIKGLAAAAVLLLISVSISYWWKGEIKVNRQHTVAVTLDTVIYALNGERKKVVLPDSTKVHLNSGSKLVYNKKFSSGNRQVYLSGEALFDVTKNPSRPFIVNTDKMLVKVLGTVFNVKSYETAEDIETMVVEGKVEVSLKNDLEKKVILLPSEKISIKSNKLFKNQQQAQVKYEVETVKLPEEKINEVPDEIAWINEKLVFTEESFEVVALKMERWYNKRFYFENEKLKPISMSGDFDKVDIQQALQILQIMVEFSYEVKGDDIYIR